MNALEVVLVTGCNGYVGRRLCDALSKDDRRIVVGVDIQRQAHPQCVLRHYHCVDLGGDEAETQMRALMNGHRVTGVIHLASYGMSGREQIARPGRIRAVNVGGTRAVLNACRARGGASLVYVSTVNVCFAGRLIENEPDVTECYAPLEAHPDEYSRSKAMAEQLVLSSSAEVPCVALRLYGIYGEGEERHFPRMIRYFTTYGMFAKFGHPSDLSDWVYVDNVVHACLVAHDKMRIMDTACVGEAFFIGDNEPINTIDLCEPLAQMVGVPYLKSVWIPYHIMYAMGWVIEILCRAYHAILGQDVEPFLTRAEVDKVARTHYWRTERAALLLGYKPVTPRLVGLSRMYSYFRKQLRDQGYPKKRGNAALLVLTVALVATLALTFVLQGQ
jgi:nucleoside-diphosphate-sugar epimerase